MHDPFYQVIFKVHNLIILDVSDTYFRDTFGEKSYIGGACRSYSHFKKVHTRALQSGDLVFL